MFKKYPQFLPGLSLMFLLYCLQSKNPLNICPNTELPNFPMSMELCFIVDDIGSSQNLLFHISRSYYGA